MIPVCVLFALYVVGSLYVIRFLIDRAASERSELEDRMMALSKPEAAILHKAARDPEPATISYVGEGFEDESNGHVDLLGDDD